MLNEGLANRMSLPELVPMSVALSGVGRVRLILKSSEYRWGIV